MKKVWTWGAQSRSLQICIDSEFLNSSLSNSKHNCEGHHSCLLIGPQYFKCLHRLFFFKNFLFSSSIPFSALVLPAYPLLSLIVLPWLPTCLLLPYLSLCFVPCHYLSMEYSPWTNLQNQHPLLEIPPQGTFLLWCIKKLGN